MKIAYHATPKTNVQDILHDGLLGAGTLAYDAHGRRPENDEPPTVHLADGMWCVDFIAGLYNLPELDIALVQVNIEGLDVEEGWDGEGTYAVLDRISKDRIIAIIYEGEYTKF